MGQLTSGVASLTCNRVDVSPPESDAEIIEGSFKDPEQFSVIFDRHYGDIHRFVVAAVGPTDGPDLAAEVFARAFEKRRGYRVSYPSARPWLWGIASNLIGDYYRGRARQERAYRRVPPVTPERDPSDDTVNRIVAETERPHLAAAMEQLRSEDAKVLLLFVVRQHSYSEIASILGVAEGTVRSRLNRTRTKLRNLMAANGEIINDDE